MAQMRTSYPDESQLMFMAFDLLHQDGCDAAVRAAQQATKTIPIIAVVDDIVAAGLIESLAKPGGNTTGVSILATELDGKRLEVLNRIVPTGRRFAILSDPSSAQAAPKVLLDAARTLGIELITEEVRSPSDFRAGVCVFSHKGRREPSSLGLRHSYQDFAITFAN